MILMPLDRGRFLVVHPCSTLSDLPTDDNTKCRSPKDGKNWGFSPREGDRINRSRRNLARKRIPWVCYSTSHLALIGKRGSVQEPPKSNLCFQLDLITIDVDITYRPSVDCRKIEEDSIR